VESNTSSTGRPASPRKRGFKARTSGQPPGLLPAQTPPLCLCASVPLCLCGSPLIRGLPTQNLLPVWPLLPAHIWYTLAGSTPAGLAIWAAFVGRLRAGTV
jgi:hypothetical protein